MRNRTRKTGEERKSEIVEVTLRLADKLGPDRLTTEAIAEAVGLTQPAIFRHFANKQELWQAVAARIGEKFQQRWLKAEESAGGSLNRLHILVGSQLRLIQQTPGISAILFSRELHAENERLRERFYETMLRFHGLIVRFIQEGQRDSELKVDLEAEDAGFLVISLVQGLVLRWSLSGRAFDLPAEGERLLAVLLRSLSALPLHQADRQ